MSCYHLLPKEERVKSVKKQKRRKGPPQSWRSDEGHRFWSYAEGAVHDPDGNWIMSPWTGKPVMMANAFSRSHFYEHCDRMIRMIARDKSEAAAEGKKRHERKACVAACEEED